MGHKPQHMVLGFKEKTPKGRKTRFKQQILDRRKKHTLREDENERWRPGVAIQFATGVRTAKYEQFAVGECKAVQRVEMRSDGVTVHVTVDGKLLSGSDHVRFYKNDGFFTREEFDEWFKPLCDKAQAAGARHIVRRLIHWTDEIRY